MGAFARFVRSILLLVVVSAGGFGAYQWYQKYEAIQHEMRDLATQVEQRRSLPAPVSPVSVPGKVATTNWMEVQKEAKDTVIKVVTNVAEFNWIEPYRKPEQGEMMGSGFFINSDGDILTNFHVVDQARLVQIEIPTLGKERMPVEIVGVNPERDVALLRLSEKAKEKIEKAIGEIRFLELGDSDEIVRGQDILALGYPLDVQALKSTQGIVSGRERVGIINQSCIQTTAPLNPGNSGGPSLNASGDVIGINFSGVVEAQNVGYIIPINDIKTAIKDMYKIRLLRRPVLGCSFVGANDDMLEYLGNPGAGGFYIVKVYKDMIMEKMGIQEGDMLYEVNGLHVDKYGDISVPWSEDKVSVVDVLNRLEVGDHINMVLYRKGERVEVSFELEPRFLFPIRPIHPDYEDVDYEVLGGLVVMELTINHISIIKSANLIPYSMPEKQYEPALLISYVQPTSIIQKLRVIGSGMLVDQINGDEVKTLDEFRQAVKKSRDTGFLTIRTREDRFGVFSVEKILADEDRLALMYGHDKSELLDVIG